MNPKLKDYLALAVIVSVLLIGVAAVSFSTSFNRSIAPTSYRSFTVTTDAKVTVIPDVAEFTVGVISQGSTDLASLQKDNTTKINALLDYVKAQGIADKDIKTSAYQIEPQYQYISCVNGGVCPPPKIVGYTINQSVTVKVRKDNFAKIGDLMSGVVSKGANSVSQLQFKVDDESAVRSQAKAEAITKARAQAEVVAKAGGFSVGRLLSIDETSNPGPIMYAMGASMDGGPMMDKAAAPNIEPGSQEVTVSVIVRYEIR